MKLTAVDKRQFPILLGTALLISFLQVACSSSGNGAGSSPAKPNLSPAIKVGQSIAVIQNAGRSQVSANLMGTPANEEKQRSEALKRIISNPGECQVKFSETQPQQGNPSAETNIGFSLNISGQSCPLNAHFVVEAKSQMNSGSMAVDYSFRVINQDAQSVIGATEGELHGSSKFGSSQDGSGISGAGKFVGYIQSLEYGRVAVEMNLKQEGGGERGVMTESLAIHFPDPSLNLDLIKATTIMSDSTTTTYTANGVEITAEEYNSIVNGIGSASPSQGQQPGQQPGGSIESLRGRMIELDVLNARTLEIISIVGNKADHVLIDGVVYPNRDLDRVVTLARPACLIQGLMRGGSYLVQDVKTDRRQAFFSSDIDLGGGSHLICLSKEAAIDLYHLTRTFSGVLRIDIR